MIEQILIDRQSLEAMLRGIVREEIGRPDRSVLTLKQLAEELQCSRQSLINWTRREVHPLPVHYLGSDPRFHRNEVDQWSKEEAQRKLASAA